MSLIPMLETRFIDKFDLFVERIIAKYEREFYGIDFQGGVSAESLGLNPELSNNCMPSGGKYLKQVLKYIEINNNDCILDIGCGKGAAMKTMRKFPFKKIGGIEISKAISDIAKKNFVKLHDQRVVIYNVDATNFKSYNNYNIYYLYNPFTEKIMSLVMERIIKSKRNNDEIVIIYDNPVHSEIVKYHGLVKVKEFPEYYGNSIDIYSNMQSSRFLL